MKTVKTPFSINLIYWFTNIFLGLLALVGIATIIFNILLFSNFLGHDLQLHITLPIKVDILETGTIVVNNETVQIELVDAIPKIHFFNTPAFISRKIAFLILFVVSWIIFQTWTFRTFIKNVKKGKIFTFRNIALLKRMAYAFAGFWLFAEIYFYAIYHYLAKNLRFENVEITDEIPKYGGLLFIALFTWVLAHIFKTGLDLRQETELTI